MCPADFVRPFAAHANWARSEARVTTLSTHRKSVAKVVSERNAEAAALPSMRKSSRLLGGANQAACPGRSRGRWSSSAERGALPKQHSHRSSVFAKTPALQKPESSRPRRNKFSANALKLHRLPEKNCLHNPWGAKAGGNQEARKRPRPIASTGPGEPTPVGTGGATAVG